MNTSLNFTEFEYQGWQQSAQQYHLSFVPLTNQMIDPLLNAVDAKAGTKLLDIATGIGYVAGEAAQRQCQVIGLDFSEAMLAKAKDLYPHVEWRQGSAESLPFGDAEFDAVVMNFGILHLAEPQRAINEAFRVLRPFGKFAFTMWDVLEKSIGLKLMYEAIQHYADLDISLPDGPPFFYFSQPENSIGALNQAGFLNPLVQYYSLNWKLANADELFDAFYQGTARTGGLLRRQSQQNIAQMRQAIRQTTQAYFQENQLVLPMSALVVSGEKIN